MPLGQRRSNVRRSNVTACHRCKSRKQRCDQNIPACSNCERAGVECVGTDIDGRVAPRSYIKSLEDRIAQLETQLMSHGLRDQSHDTPTSVDFSAVVTHGVSNSPTSQGHNSQADEDLVGQIVLDSLRADHFSSAIANHNGLSLLNSLLSGPITKVSRPGLKSDHRTLFEDLPYETRIDMPRGEAASRLIDTYFEHCDFFSPILSSKEHLACMMEPLYDAAANLPPPPSSSSSRSLSKANFRASMVFATAILLINRTDPSVPVERSHVYFAAAMRMLSQDPAAVCTGDLDHLVDLLLIVQYCCFSPNLTAAWHFLGLATRLAVELGLHNERQQLRHGSSAAAAACLDPGLVEERRWIFWATYTFERNFCVSIGRPFSIADEAIDTPLPAEPCGNPRRAQALHLIKARRFESEIYATLRQRRPADMGTTPPPSDWKPAWRASITARLREWIASVPPPPEHEGSSQLMPQQIFEGFFHNAFVNIYYPSQHFPDLGAADVGALARHAGESVACYKKSFRSRELRFYWRCIHSLFKAGVALVYCIRVSATLSSQQRQQRGEEQEINVANLVDTVNDCSSIIWAMVERYPQGQAYRDVFESLVNSVLGKDGDDQRQQNAPQQQQQPCLVVQQQAGSGGDEPQDQSIFDSLFAAASEDTDLPFTAIEALSWGFAQPSPVG